MGDTPLKKVLDSALNALLKGLELSPWVKVPATFVAELSSRFRNLPDEEKKALVEASPDDVREGLLAVDCDDKEQLEAAVGKATYRGQVLDHLYGLTSPAVDELVTRTPGASRHVTKDTPPARKVSEFVEFLESSEGPGLESLNLPF